MKRNREIMEKEGRVREFLQDKGLSGMLLCRQDNFSWLTGGKGNSVVMGADVGFNPVLVTAEAKYLITNNIEAPRLVEEELKGQEFELVILPWWKFDDQFLKKVKDLCSGKIGSDTCIPRLSSLGSEFSELRYVLTSEEKERYYSLGRDSARAVEATCREIRIGQSEYQIAALLAGKLLAHGIIPSVLLVGTDERVFAYRHPIPTQKKLQKYAMVVLVGVRGGLNVALTRLVHFGPAPQEIVKKHRAALEVDAAFIVNTVPGIKYSAILEKGAQAYANAGYPDEWQKHFQGGPIGYGAREFDATPDTHQLALVNQAVAWNPTIAGVKTEDTFILGEKSRQMISITEDWPMVTVEVAGEVIQRPDILERG